MPRNTSWIAALLCSVAMLLPHVAISDATEFSKADDQGRYRFLVTLGDDGLLQRGVLPRKGQGSASRSPAFLSAKAELQSEQADALSAMSRDLGRNVKATHYFLASSNAVGVRLTEREADLVRALPGIVSVERERVYELQTYRGPEFIGAGEVWNGNATPDGSPLRGEGMVAAVLDSGTVLDHPSFANDAACGHGTGGTPDKLLSAVDCASTDVDGMCNGPTPVPLNAHGVHVAGTVAGNTIDNSDSLPPNPPAPFTSVSGVAPCAHLRTYRVCVQGCPGFDVQAGMDSVLLDGDVDVMNFSISGGTSPWVDNDRKKLDLVASGVFVAASAGNTRAATPNPVGAVNHRGPWVMSVANSTHDGTGQGDVLSGGSLRGPTPAPLADLQKPDITAPGTQILASYGDFTLDVTQPTAPSDLQDITLIPGSDSPIGIAFTDLPIRSDPNQASGAEGCNAADGGVPFPANFFDGAVALVQRGSCSFTDKINNAAAAGADTVVIFNNAADELIMNTAGQAAVQAFSASLDEGVALRNYISGNPGAAVTHSGLIDISSWALLSGTSMSSPHVAGAAVLVRQAQPDWDAVEVKTALQMTATGDAGTKEDGTTPWDWDDVGSGRVDLTAAALAGLVMTESFANFLASNPSSGGDVKTLNLPSVRNRSCDPDCTFTRTVTAGQPFDTSWTVTTAALGGDMTISVTPTSFSLDGRTDLIFADGIEDVGIPVPVRQQELTITISNVDPGAIRFGEIILSEDSDLTPPARITAAAER